MGWVYRERADPPPFLACRAELEELNIPHSWSIMLDIREISDERTNLFSQCLVAPRLIASAQILAVAILVRQYRWHHRAHALSNPIPSSHGTGLTSPARVQPPFGDHSCLCQLLLDGACGEMSSHLIIESYKWSARRLVQAWVNSPRNMEASERISSTSTFAIVRRIQLTHLVKARLLRLRYSASVR